MAVDWISGAEAADIIGVSRSTVLRSLQDEIERSTRWGAENVGWRFKPMSRRGVFQVSRKRAVEIAKGEPADPPFA
jgi:hypothetical protein